MAFKKKYETIEEYIQDQNQDDQKLLNEFRKFIKQNVPDAEESISYQIPTFRLHGILVHFAIFKKHLGFYPTPSGIIEFADQLSNYETTKGTIKFPKNEPIPWELIKRILSFRVKENLEKSRAKMKK